MNSDSRFAWLIRFDLDSPPEIEQMAMYGGRGMSSHPEVQPPRGTMTDSSLFLLYQAVAAVAEADEVVDTVEAVVADTVDPVPILTEVVAVVVSCAE
jgi:hypothetical protein